MYLRIHLQLYVFLQRIDMIPSSKWFPNLMFFVPWSATSPIPAPPPLKDFRLDSLIQWAAGALLSAAPFAAFVLLGRLWREVTSRLWQVIYGRLPNTVHRRKPLPYSTQLQSPLQDTSSSYEPPLEEQIEEAEAVMAESTRQGEEELGTFEPDTAEPTSEVSAPEPSTRAGPSTTRGDEYVSEDEENDVPGPALITFDVEATDATDAAPGLWSAELRPSTGPDARSPSSQQLVYLDTMLTRLPACLAADIFTVIAGYIIVAPYEAQALRLIARAFRTRMGLPTFDIYEVGTLSGLTRGLLTNFVGIEFVHLVIAVEMWAMVTLVAQGLHLTEEEFKEFQELDNKPE
jgi:hypothetical protein